MLPNIPQSQSDLSGGLKIVGDGQTIRVKKLGRNNFSISAIGGRSGGVKSAAAIEGPFSVVDSSDDDAQKITVLGYNTEENRYFQSMLILGKYRQAFPETTLTLTTTTGTRIIVLETKETVGQTTYTITLKDLAYTEATGVFTADTDDTVNYPLALVRFTDAKIAEIVPLRSGWIIDLARGF